MKRPTDYTYPRVCRMQIVPILYTKSMYMPIKCRFIDNNLVQLRYVKLENESSNESSASHSQSNFSDLKHWSIIISKLLFYFTIPEFLSFNFTFVSTKLFIFQVV